MSSAPFRFPASDQERKATLQKIGLYNETIDFVTIGGVPSGAVLSAGSDNGDGSWTLSEGDLAGLTITPAADVVGQFFAEPPARRVNNLHP